MNECTAGWDDGHTHTQPDVKGQCKPLRAMDDTSEGGGGQFFLFALSLARPLGETVASSQKVPTAVIASNFHFILLLSSR